MRFSTIGAPRNLHGMGWMEGVRKRDFLTWLFLQFGGNAFTELGMASSQRIDAINEIANLLSTRRGPWKRLLDPDTTDPLGAAERLLTGIRNGKLTEGSEKVDQLAKRVLDRLKLQVLMLEVGPPADSVAWTRQVHALRDIIVAIMLFAYARRRAAMHILVKAYATMRELEMTFAELRCLRFMRTHASLEGDVKEVDRIDRLLQRMREIDDAENQADYLEERVTARLASTSSRRRNDARMTHDHAASVDELRRRYDRHILHQTYFRLASRAFQQDGDDLATVKVCREARAYYRRKPQFATPTRLGEFTLKEFVSLVALRRLDDANALVEEMRSQLSANQAVWPVVLRYVLQLHLLRHDIASAADVCVEVRGLRHRLRSQHQRDEWRFLEAYLHVMADIGVADRDDITQRLGAPSFYMGNLRRSLAAIAKDKHGVDVGLQILNYLRLLERKRYNDVIALRESLALYVKRYVREPSLKRSNLFLRMLLRIPRHEFDAASVAQACSEMFTRLRALQVDDDAELLPYERLWEAIIELLERNARTERRRR